jgi:hypothetical protein
VYTTIKPGAALEYALLITVALVKINRSKPKLEKSKSIVSVSGYWSRSQAMRPVQQTALKRAE